MACATKTAVAHAARVATMSSVLKRRANSSKTKAMPPSGVLNATARPAPAAALCTTRTAGSVRALR